MKAGVLAAAALPLAASVTEAQAPSEEKRDSWHGLKVSVASYSLRKMPLEAAIKAIQRTGLKYVSIKDVHMPMKSTAEERRAVVQRFKDAGITPLSCGNVAIKNDEADIRAAFEYARDAGLPTIVCAPHPDSIPILDRMVKEFDIRLAIHNHGPGDKFPSPNEIWPAIEKYDRRIGFCIDVGHTVRAGVDPTEAILKYRDRLYDMHFKDLNGKQPKAAPVEVGRGVLDIKGMLKAVLEIRYTHLLSFEYEKDADDPLPGLMESIGYVKGVLTGLRR